MVRRNCIRKTLAVVLALLQHALLAVVRYLDGAIGKPLPVRSRQSRPIPAAWDPDVHLNDPRWRPHQLQRLLWSIVRIEGTM
eukprot:9002717-Pyramimonas_sp.AAC.1